MALTVIKTVKDLRKYHLEPLKGKGQVYDNHKSTLKGFLSANDWSDDTPLDVAFDGGFEKAAQKYEEVLRATMHAKKKPESINTLNTQRYLLNKLKKSAMAIGANAKLPDTFGARLRELLRRMGMTPRGLQKAMEEKKLENITPFDTVRSWLSGRFMPQNDADTKLRVKEMEKFLNAEGKLCEVLHFTNRSKIAKTSFGKRLVIAMAHKYRYLLRNWTSAHKSEWKDIAEYYSKNATGIKETRTKKWRTKEGGKKCATAEKHQGALEAFFGWAILKKDPNNPINGGGVKKGKLSFAHLSYERVKNFLEFMHVRAGGYNAFTRNFAKLATMLLKPDTGYVWRNPERFAPKVGKNPADWQKYVEAERDQINHWLNQLEKAKLIKQTRIVEEPIDKILRIQHPKDVLTEMLIRMTKDTPPSSASPIRKARHARNVLLIAMLSENPLRASQYAMMEWEINLYKLKTGDCRGLKYKSVDFKNEQGAASEPYNVILTPRLTPLIEHYQELRKYLPFSDKTNRVFLPDGTYSTRTMKAKMEKGEFEFGYQSNGISALVRELTKEYLGGDEEEWAPNGFGPHAFRHINAHEFIKNNMEGFQVVAHILHDRLQTVMDDYGHIKVADGFSAWQTYSDAQYVRYMDEKEAA